MKMVRTAKINALLQLQERKGKKRLKEGEKKQKKERED